MVIVTERGDVAVFATTTIVALPLPDPPPVSVAHGAPPEAVQVDPVCVDTARLLVLAV